MTCPTGKLCFATALQARRHASAMHARGDSFTRNVHTYQCDCGAWHMTAKASRELARQHPNRQAAARGGR